jgi:DNA-binding response OmpR family regulator
LASTEDYEVIILDLMLPKMTGGEICQNLRKNGVHTPILILTARGEVEDKVAGLNCGADDYLVKPFSFVELVARIRALARRPKKNLEIILEIEDLRLNTQTFEVTRGGKKIILSKKEFLLLEYLMRKRGQIINKDQMINSIWNYEANILPNTIEVYIGYLRNKIDRPFGKKPKLIQTVRGFGYKVGRS